MALRKRNPQLQALMRRFGRTDAEWDLVGDGQPVAFKSYDFARVIGEHAQ